MSLQERIYRAFAMDPGELPWYRDVEPSRSASPESADEETALEDYEFHFIKKFAYNTNAIEGSTLTYGDTESLLEGTMPKGIESKELGDVKAAIGAKEGYELAMLRLKDRAPVSEDLIKDIHQATALDCDIRTRGIYRVTPVYITNSMTVPANPDKVRSLMADLMFAYGNSGQPAIFKAAAFHAMFENIHPFRDGNGRTGRILLNYMLVEAGYPPIAIKAADRHAYAKALEDWQVRDEPRALVDLVRECVAAETSSRANAIEMTRSAVKTRTPQELESWAAKSARLAKALESDAGGIPTMRDRDWGESTRAPGKTL